MKQKNKILNEELKKLICKRIINLRKEHNLTLIELSEKSNISIDELVKIEKYLKSPKLYTIYNICSGLNISLYNFFDWDKFIEFLK